MEENKQKIIDTIRAAEKDLIELSLNIHDNPELGFEEYRALGFISGFLEKYGFKVEKGYGGLPTSFRADVKKKEGAPTLAILAEYDALRGVGHGCGHNLIATCSTSAFLGLASVADKLDGNICIIGTPAEEGGAGKVKLLRNGAFDDIDFAVMMHPSSGGANLVGRGGRAAATVTVDYHGRGAHSSTPQFGVNALSSVLNLFQQIDLMRPTLWPQDNINGVIINGGTAANVIPPEARCEFCVRADTMKRTEELVALIRKCAENAAALVGTEMDFDCGDIYAERYPNKPMCQSFKDNMESLGIPMAWPDPTKQYGSSDIGNVSIRIPAIHDYLSITDDPEAQAHTKAFAAAAASPEAQQVCLKGGMGLAMTGYDILTSEEFRREIQDYHEKQIPDFYKEK